MNESTKVLVIAETGSCWLHIRGNNAYRAALKMIRLAHEAGADAVKFQWVSDAEQMAARRKLAKSSYDYLSWPVEWHASFAEECHQLKLFYVCSIYLPQDVSAVLPYVDWYKVASLEFQAMDLIATIHSTTKPFLISNGVSSSKVSADDFRGAWANKARLLHCTAGYPCPLNEVNLRAMQMVDGFSDHTANILTGAVAVGAGARYIEVHYRLNETRHDCPDYNHSLGPGSLKQYIANVRLAETLMGDGKKQVMASEACLVKHRVIHA